MKPGIKSSEFWLALVAMVCISVPTLFIDNPPQWAQVAGLIGTALVSMGYGVSRALTKQGSTEVTYAPYAILDTEDEGEE